MADNPVMHSIGSTIALVIGVVVAPVAIMVAAVILYRVSSRRRPRP